MNEKPILFSGAMIRAILDGSKTQTRRLLKHEPQFGNPETGDDGFWRVYNGDVVVTQRKMPFVEGQQLWVRETWQTHCDQDHITPRDLPHDSAVQYPATYDHWVSKKRPGIHMPRWASRITLEVTEVRVERLQSISEEDARAEGAIRMVTDDEMKFYDDDQRGTHRCGFAGLWAHINGVASWEANPWVFVISFKRIV